MECMAGFVGIRTTVLFWRERKARQGVEGWPGRHSQAFDHRGNGPRELGEPQTASARIVAFADAREEAAHAGGGRTGEQDGSENMGHADEAGRLSRPGSGCGGVKPPRITRTGEEV